MRYLENESEYELSSGRRFYANGGILGMEPDGEHDVLHHGYDGTTCPETGREKFTDDERREIAVYMIDLWRKWGGVTTEGAA